MITVGMNYRVIAGKEKVFEAAFEKVLEAMRSDPGHRVTGLYKNVFEPGCYLISSDWSSRDSFDAFIRSELFAKVTSWGAEQVLQGRPHHEIYER